MDFFNPRNPRSKGNIRNSNSSQKCTAQLTTINAQTTITLNLHQMQQPQGSYYGQNLNFIQLRKLLQQEQQRIGIWRWF